MCKPDDLVQGTLDLLLRLKMLASKTQYGYTTYIRLVQDLIGGKEVVRTGMTEEIGRARIAVERAQAGAKVVIISSGDAGVYGMCGLVFQVLKELGWTRGDAPELRIVSEELWARVEARIADQTSSLPSMAAVIWSLPISRCR